MEMISTAKSPPRFSPGFMLSTELRSGCDGGVAFKVTGSTCQSSNNAVGSQNIMFANRRAGQYLVILQRNDGVLAVYKINS